MAERPNILLILVDDMGYSDIGCFGGEIETPNIDRLAAGGQKFTQFYNLARCCPSRATIMTGLHPHQTGIGHMTNVPTDRHSEDRGVFGYRGFLNRSCATAGEVLGDAGYHTYLAGKWHLGQAEFSMWPTQRGFEKFYGMLWGATNYLKPRFPVEITYMDEKLEVPEPYYTTDAFTDYALKFMQEQKDDNPFFLYLAYNAPHWPLQAPEETIKKYRGKYLCGWDKLREARYQKQKELGILNGRNCPLSPRDPDVRAWDTLDDAKKDEMDLRMAVYAAQIDRVDQNIGRVLKYLENSGKLDNTLIMFLSDNGACAEGGELGKGKVEEINKADIPSLVVSYGRCWANASNTPFRMYKHYVHEGGIATPLIVHWPNGIADNGYVHEPGHLIDIVPTMLEAAGTQYPKRYHGYDIPVLEGMSLFPFFKNKNYATDRYLYWEHEENCSIRYKNYKAVHRYDVGKWELYDLDKDASELNDISSAHPDIVQRLSSKWYYWAETHHVVPKWKVYP